MNEETTVALGEQWYVAEYVDEEGKYQKVKWRTIEVFKFYVRPFNANFVPCKKCQQELKNLVLSSPWIFGNKDYEPQVELNRRFNEIDDDSWITLEEHKATPEEKKRLGTGWNYLEG